MLNSPIHNLSLTQDSVYDLRLMSRSNKVLSEPSESVSVSTTGMFLFLIIIESDINITGYLLHLFIKHRSEMIDFGLITGMEIYPLRPSFLEVIPEPLMAGVIGGACFLLLAIILSLVTACYMSNRRRQRHRKRRQGKT